jgi:hypothetical protein
MRQPHQASAQQMRDGDFINPIFSVRASGVRLKIIYRFGRYFEGISA